MPNPSDQPEPMDDLPEGTDAMSSSPGPGDLAALAARPSTHDEPRDAVEPLDEFRVPAENQPPGVTGLVIGNPEAKRRAQAAEWSEE
jgi:hypothetical protein